MMDFQQRLEEIRRRSEVLKEKQRKRKKQLLIILPLSLCLALSIGILPELFPSATDDIRLEDTPERGQPMEPMGPEQSASTTLSVKRIAITGKGLDRTVSDPAVINDICILWQTITAPAPSFSISGTPVGGSGQDPTHSHDGYSTETPNEKGSPKDYYILSFTEHDCTVRKYKLNESVLTDLSTGVSDFLTGADLNALYTLLGLPVE